MTMKITLRFKLYLQYFAKNRELPGSDGFVLTSNLKQKAGKQLSISLYTKKYICVCVIDI